MQITREEVQALNNRVAELGITRAEVAREAGVVRETVYNTFDRGRFNLEVIAAASRLVKARAKSNVVTPATAVKLLREAIA